MLPLTETVVNLIRLDRFCSLPLEHRSLLYLGQELASLLNVWARSRSQGSNAPSLCLANLLTGALWQKFNYYKISEKYFNLTLKLL